MLTLMGDCPDLEASLVREPPSMLKRHQGDKARSERAY